MESEAYKNIEDIEKLVENSMDLSVVPLQPLYLCIRGTSQDYLASILPKLSKKQRSALIDIDSWSKDNLELNSFSFWLETYSKCQKLDIVKEFVSSQDFFLFLKGQFNIATFDLEDPHYPEHDNFFVTDDNQFLFEFNKDFNQARETQYLVKVYYSVFGTEEASFNLLQLINEPFFTMQEEVYENRVSRIRDFGFVDYFDSLVFRSAFASIKELDKFIQNKVQVTGDLDAHNKNQTLHRSSLMSFRKGLDNVHDSLLNIKEEKRRDYLQFNFVRLINGTIALDDSLKSGSLAMTKTGEKTKQKIQLGFNYVLEQSKEKKNIFERFDFSDLYKIGHSLLYLGKKGLKKDVESSSFNSDNFEFFLGAHWSQFLQHSFDEVIKFFNPETENFEELEHYSDYKVWVEQSQTFRQLLPFVETFFQTMQNLLKEGKINSEFYLNYSAENIDFEAIVLSSFVNYCLGHFEKDNVNKMGLTVEELKTFASKYFIQNKSEYYFKTQKDAKTKKKMEEFSKQFGFHVVDNFNQYLELIIHQNLDGYEFDSLENEDFKHVGGPILLNTKQ